MKKRIISFCLICVMLFNISGCSFLDSVSKSVVSDESINTQTDALAENDKTTEAITEAPTEPPTQAPTVPAAIALAAGFSHASVPAYSGVPSIIINGDVPFFTSDLYVTTPYDLYGDLDSLGRATTCMACLSVENMQSGERSDRQP